LPPLLAQLSSPRLHEKAILKELSRGQFYKALALAEEFEKKYPGSDGTALTGLCAFYLGRGHDTLQVIRTGLAKTPHHGLLLTVKALVDDAHAESGATSRIHALFDLDRWSEALTEAKKFSAAFPRFADGHLVRARIALELRKLAEAEAALQEASRREPGNPELEILLTQLHLLGKKSDSAQDALGRALRRGYHRPSVNLLAGLIALRNGSTQEATAIFGEALQTMPFWDRDAYPLFVRLALGLEAMPQARAGLDEWRTRMPQNSAYAYLEGLYCFRIGENQRGLDWIRKGWRMNTNQLTLLEQVIGMPALLDDPDLAGKIRTRLAAAGVSDVVPAVAAGPTSPAGGDFGEDPGTALPGDAGDGAVSGAFRVEMAAGLPPHWRDDLLALLNDVHAQISQFLGPLTEIAFVNLVPAAGMGSQVAMYDADNNSLMVTGLVFDPGTMRVFVEAEKPWMGENQLAHYLFNLPGHQLGRELALMMILRQIPRTAGSVDAATWLVNGLAEASSGRSEVLGAKLGATQRHLANNTAKLLGIEQLNDIFTEGYSGPQVLETAQVQAYLMVAFLLKKSGARVDGSRTVLEMIKEVAGGEPIDRALRKHFKIGANEFESGWKEAAFWALKQGTPYEW
jgi:tetratricopeptide (TPR) repeat protein